MNASVGVKMSVRVKVSTSGNVKGPMRRVGYADLAVERAQRERQVEQRVVAWACVLLQRRQVRHVEEAQILERPATQNVGRTMHRVRCET